MRVLAGLRRREKLRCRQAVELLTDYLEGVLSPQEQSRLEAHLRACDGCRTYLDQLRATISALGRGPLCTARFIRAGQADRPVSGLPRRSQLRGHTATQNSPG